MPQLDPTFYPSQLFWLAVTFLTLYAVLAAVVLPRVAEALENRQREIAGGLEKAERLRQEAEQAEKAYKTALEDARAQANALIAEATAEANQHVANRQAELDKILQRKTSDAEQRIQQAKKQAYEQIASVTQELVGLAVRRLVKAEITAQQVKQAVAHASDGKDKDENT